MLESPLKPIGGVLFHEPLITWKLLKAAASAAVQAKHDGKRGGGDPPDRCAALTADGQTMVETGAAELVMSKLML